MMGLLTFPFLPLAAVHHDVIFAVFVTTDATVLAAHTLLHNTLHLEQHTHVTMPCLAQAYHSLAVLTDRSADECVLYKLVSKFPSQI